MILSVILDLTEDNYCRSQDPSSIFTNLHIFLNSFLTLSHDNNFHIINNQKIIFNSAKDDLTSLMSKLSSQPGFCLSRDLGYSLLYNKPQSNSQQKTRIFILNASQPSVTNLIKCSFVAEKLDIRIDALSLYPCPVLNQVCHTNNGVYDEVGNIEFFISLLWDEKSVKMKNYGIVCLCHEKIIEYGLVCPVCLSVYCRFAPICKKCKTKMSFLK